MVKHSSVMTWHHHDQPWKNVQLKVTAACRSNLTIAAIDWLCSTIVNIYNINMDNFVEEVEKSDYEVATEAFQACKSSIEKERKKTWLKCITYRQCSFVPWYKEEIRKEVPENIQSTDRFSVIEHSVKKLIPSINARCALQEMVNMNNSIIDIFFFCKVDLLMKAMPLKKRNYGITKWLHFLVSKCWSSWIDR